MNEGDEPQDCPEPPPPPKGPDGLDCTPTTTPYTFGRWMPWDGNNGVNYFKCVRWHQGSSGQSSWPIRYGTGEIQMTVVDLPAGGFGLPWGHVRSYLNQLRTLEGELTSANYGNGNNWLVRQAAYVVDAYGDLARLIVVLSPQRSVAFDLVGDHYVGDHGALQTLEHDSTAQVYRFSQVDGVVWEFFDFDQTENPSGLLSRVASAGGQTTTLTYPNAESPVTEVERSFTDAEGVTTRESFLYAYLDGPGENAGNVESVTLRRSVDDSGWSAIRRVRFTYYDSTSAGGGTATWSSSGRSCRPAPASGRSSTLIITATIEMRPAAADSNTA